MQNFFLIFVWIILTLAITTFAAILGKRYGPEYPIAMVAALIVAANILANKIINVGGLIVPGGVLVFSMTFLLTDIISEKWGKHYAKKAVWTGFLAQVVFVISLWIIIKWPSPEFTTDAATAFGNVLALSPRIALASMIAYLASQNHDVWAYHFWKKKTKGKHLWLRNNASTTVSQLIDSTIFVSIAFYGIMPIAPLIIGQWIIKTAIAALDTPFMYLGIKMMEKVKNIRNPIILDS